ncbi:MAG: hypothetical protein ONB05_00365 [candidate division KSB1 bacterium]|nr:hypothetical protein [candidate division KSB1 bacterium]
MIKDQNIERNLFEVLVPPADMVMDQDLQNIDHILDEDPTL